MPGINDLLDAYDAGEPAPDGGVGINALLDAYEQDDAPKPSPRPAAKSRAEEPKRKRGGLILPQPSMKFEPGARTDGGTIIPEPVLGAVESVGAAVQSAPGGRAGSRILAGVGREASQILPGIVGAAGQVGRWVNGADVDERLSQMRQAGAIGVSPDRTLVSPMPEGNPIAQMVKDTATGMQRRYIDQPVPPAERMRAGQRQQAAEIGVPAQNVTASANPRVVRGLEQRLNEINPAVPGEPVGLDRQMDEPLSVLSDALSVYGLMAKTVPRGPDAKTFAAAKVARGEDVRAGRVQRGAERAAARPTAQPAARVTIERVPEAPPPGYVATEGARAASLTSKTKADAVASGLRFNAQRIAAEMERADVLEPEAVGAKIDARGGTRLQRRAAERAEVRARAAGERARAAEPERVTAERSKLDEAARAAERDRAANKVWTANDVRDELKVNFGEATRIAKLRNDKLSKARETAELVPGEAAVIRVGDKTIQVSTAHTENPVLLRALNDAVREAKAASAPARAADTSPFSAKPVEAAPRKAPPPPPGSAAPPRPVAPKVRDAITGNDYAAKISGAAEDAPTTVARRLTMERRREVQRGLLKEKGAAPALSDIVDATYAGYNRTLDLLAEGTRRGAKNLGRTTDATVRAALSPAGVRARAIADASGDFIGGNAAKGGKAALDFVQKFDGRPHAAAHYAIKLWNDAFHAASKRTPESILKWQRERKIDVIEPREAVIKSIINDIATTDFKALRDLVFEYSFEGMPKHDPVTAKIVDDARPTMGKLSGLLQDLGARNRHHGLITEHTHDFMGPNYVPHGLVQGTRRQIQAGLFAPGGFMQNLAAKNVKVKKRKLTDLEFWNEHGQRKDLVGAITDVVMTQHERLDRLDAIEAIAQDPNLAVPIKSSLKERALRQRQYVYLSNAADDGAVTLLDAHSAVATAIDKIERAREAENVSLGVDPKLRATLSDRVNRLDAQWTKLAARKAELLELNAHPGIATIDDAKAFVKKAEEAAQAKIDDLPNEVERISAQTGVRYIPVTEAYERIGRRASDGHSEALGEMQSGYIAESLADSGVMDTLAPFADGPINRSLDALRDMWAFGHTVANPASWLNQGLGASALAALGRFPLWAQPQFVSKALGDILGNEAAVTTARRAGLDIHPDLTRADIRADFAALLENGVTPGKLEKVSKKMRSLRWAKGYRIPDDAMRLGMYDFNIRVRKMAPEAAAKNANHWVLSASDKPVMLTKMQRSKLGALVPDFLSIPMQSVPRLVEGALTNSAVAIALGTLGWSSRKLAQMTGLLTDEEEGIRGNVRSTAETMSTLTVPITEKGNVVEASMGGWNPYGGFSMRGGAGAFLSMWDAVTNAPDKRTGLQSTNPARRVVQGVIGWNLGEALDVIDAASTTRGRTDENGEPVTLRDAMTKLLVPVNYRAPSTDTIEGYAESDAKRAERKLTRVINKLREEDAATPEVEAAYEAAVEEVWRDSGLDEETDDAGAPTGDEIDYSKPLRLGVQR